MHAPSHNLVCLIAIHPSFPGMIPNFGNMVLLNLDWLRMVRSCNELLVPRCSWAHCVNFHHSLNLNVELAPAVTFTDIKKQMKLISYMDRPHRRHLLEQGFPGKHLRRVLRPRTYHQPGPSRLCSRAPSVFAVCERPIIPLPVSLIPISG